MKSPVFTGSATALVTPFKASGVNFDKLGELIEYQIENGTSALVINGTTGEASTQSIPEHLAVIEYAVRRVNGRIPVIAGTGSNDTADAITMSRSAEESGADALLIVNPYYNKTTQRGLVAHYTAIADSVNVPIILYNVPSRTNMSFVAGTYRELSAHKNIVGVKEASDDITLVAKTRAVCPPDFYIWSGDDAKTVPMMSLGALGVISVASNIIPREMAEITAFYLSGKTKEAADLQIKYNDLFDKLFIEVNPVPVKAAMNILGLDVGPLRMPLVELAPENREKLISAMKSVGLMV
ncbi:MAG: 4-hydroxy-tetrahydrodipicolinate synthase [Oscillospiraceae bacterium]|jgi:4-hydroxy-tetrahydrodipicolinate synthase|nr:4-hydroxy-tetrahydrodipicolinate synthase [Oscillospiraceae bacterium]